MKLKVLPVIIFVLSTILVGCSLGNQGADSCDAGGTLFFDDFSGAQECGWRLYNQGGSIAAIDSDAEALQISTSQPGQMWWSIPGRNFDDVIITTTTTQISGPDNNAYGIICRYQDENNFYAFLISGDGYYAIGKYQTGTNHVIYLTENQEYIPSDAIQQGTASNEIRVSCVGNELGLQVNGMPLVTVVDPTFVRGDVGVGVSTLETGTAVVQFDDFRVLQP